MSEQDSGLETHGRVGHYQLLEQRSDCFFGPRYRVRAGPDYAVRALRLITTEAPERFASAAAAIRDVAHPSLLPPLELVRPGRGLAVVTEDVAGETLRSLLDRAVQLGESIPESIALRGAIDVLEGLHALELADVRLARGPHLHGGLTLDSIHVGADGRTRLIDPGVAAMAAREPAFARHPVRAAYTAPEHADGRVRFDTRSDVFSLGVVLWEVLACRSLFGAASFEAVLERVLHERVARPQRERFLRGEPVSAAVAAVVDHALQRDPDRRFQTYAQLCDALRSAARVAESEEVASFMAGMWPLTSLSLPASAAVVEVAPAVEALTVPPPAPPAGPAAPVPRLAPAAWVIPAPPITALVLRPSHALAASDAFVVNDLARTEPRRPRGLIPLLVALVLVLMLGAVALRRAEVIAGLRPSDRRATAATVERPEAQEARPSEPSAPLARGKARPARRRAPSVQASEASAPLAPPSPVEGQQPQPPPPPPVPSTGPRPARAEQTRTRARSAAPATQLPTEYIPDGI